MLFGNDRIYLSLHGKEALKAVSNHKDYLQDKRLSLETVVSRPFSRPLPARLLPLRQNEGDVFKLTLSQGRWNVAPKRRAQPRFLGDNRLYWAGLLCRRRSQSSAC